MKITKSAFVPALLAGLLAACQPSAKTADQPTKAETAFGESVRAYLLEHPEVIKEAVAKLQDKERAEALAQAHADARQLLPKHRAALERDGRDYVANPGGRITLVEFFDYNCGYCKLAAPEILRIIKENPDVRVVFKELPIFGAASDTAARIALTEAGKANALALYQTWMAEKPLDEAGIDRHLTELGLNPTAVRKAAAAPAIDKQIADVRELALALKIQGTPVFIIGDVMIPGADMDALRTAITQARAADIRPAGVASGA
jgi:protein-disulfide isomerase